MELIVTKNIRNLGLCECSLVKNAFYTQTLSHIQLRKSIKGLQLLNKNSTFFLDKLNNVYRYFEIFTIINALLPSFPIFEYHYFQIQIQASFNNRILRKFYYSDCFNLEIVLLKIRRQLYLCCVEIANNIILKYIYHYRKNICKFWRQRIILYFAHKDSFINFIKHEVKILE